MLIEIYGDKCTQHAWMLRCVENLVTVEAVSKITNIWSPSQSESKKNMKEVKENIEILTTNSN